MAGNVTKVAEQGHQARAVACSRVKIASPFVETIQNRLAVAGSRVAMVADDFSIQEALGLLFPLTVSGLWAASSGSSIIGYSEFRSVPGKVSADILVLASSRMFENPKKVGELGRALETFRAENPGAAVVAHLMVDSYACAVSRMVGDGLIDHVSSDVLITDRQLILMGGEILRQKITPSYGHE